MTTSRNISPTNTNAFTEKFIQYPAGYDGQDLGESYVFISESGGKAMLAQGHWPSHYLQLFAEEVARAKTRRAREYQNIWKSGQRYLWTFCQHKPIALLSIVVLLPEGPRPVMVVIGTDDHELFDETSNLRNHAELYIRVVIETSLGTMKMNEKPRVPSSRKKETRH